MPPAPEPLRGFVWSLTNRQRIKTRSTFERIYPFGSSVGDARRTESSGLCKQFAPKVEYTEGLANPESGAHEHGDHSHADHLWSVLFVLSRAVDNSHAVVCGQILVCARTAIRTGLIAFLWEARGKGALAVNESVHTHSRGSRL